MGESIVDFPKDAEKVEEATESNSSNSALEVSISFGRFENDSLSWEKWSTFSPNKYLEEVEKCATPGSVAQKRAYFEAHYKKIAARKAEELLEQEKQLQDEPFRSDGQEGGDQIDFGTDFEIDLTNCQRIPQGNCQEVSLDNEISSTHVYDLEEDDVITIECQGPLTEGEKEEKTDSRTVSPNLSKPEELVLGQEVVNIPADSQGRQEIPKTLDNNIGNAPEVKVEKVGKTRLDLRKGSNKVTPVSKERNVANVKKKPITPTTKTPPKSTPKSTPRVSKPISTSTATPASRSSVKKSNSSSLPRSKIASTEESKKVAPKSLHMSPSSDPTRSDSATVTTTRKSFIMEKMGDKDIVKRAFKTFQNNFNQPISSSEEKSPTPKQQLSTKGKESRVSTFVPLPKENGGPLKMGTLEKRSAKAAPSSFGLGSDERAEKIKEFPKKLEAKSDMKEAGRTHLQRKSKNQKEAEIKKLGQSRNCKATPTPSISRGQKMSKSISEKESSKNETLR